MIEESDALHARARAFIDAYDREAPFGAPHDGTVKLPEPFDTLACDLARFQARAIPGYARLLTARGVAGEDLRYAEGIPGVPTDVFKEARVSVFAESETPHVFRTSGTTVGKRGTHALRTLENDDLASLAVARRAFDVRDGARKPRFLMLTPSPREAPDSSLVHMFDTIARGLGTTLERAFFIQHDRLELVAFERALDEGRACGDETIVLGTSFAYVHLLEGLSGRSLRDRGVKLALHTGGTKGRVREIAPKDLEREIARLFGIEESACLAEYGMTELTSEFFRSPYFGSDVYMDPPWARVFAVDPVSLGPVPDGSEGLAKIVDLLNVDGAVAILTQDRVVREHGGFRVVGRTKGAIPRGCSLSIEEMLG